jgi:uncharacterized protein (DUF302 family)
MHSKLIMMVCLAGLSLIGKAQALTVYQSKLNVEQTTEKIVDLIKEKDLIFFETVSHKKIAEQYGFSLAETNVILFEDPDLTTKLIQCEQTVALDLPLKIVVWEESDDVYIGYLDPLLMRRRFLVTGCDDALAEMSKMMVRLANETLKER